MELLDDGRITLDLDDGKEPITLRRPKYGAFKRFRIAIQDMSTATTEAVRKMQEIEDDDARIAALSEIDTSATVGLEALWRDIVGTLGDRPLPDDVDDWPAELIIGKSIISRIMEHWRTRPLDRGEMGRPTPSR